MNKSQKSKVMKDKKLIWGKDLPTYSYEDKKYYEAISYSERKPKNMPLYIDAVTGKRTRYTDVKRKKFHGVWVTFVR